MKKHRTALNVFGVIFCAICSTLVLCLTKSQNEPSAFASVEKYEAFEMSLAENRKEIGVELGTTTTAATTTTTTSSTTSSTTTATTTATTTTTAVETTAVMEDVETEPVDYVWYYSDYEVPMLASLISNEIGGSDNYAQLTAVAWCVCNRIESTRWEETTVSATIQRPNQFAYYGGAIYEGKCYDIAATVLQEWNDEMNYPDYVGPSRSIPKDYLSFWGDGTYNHFSNDYNEIIPGI